MGGGPRPPSWVEEKLREGIVIPAHPLALGSDRRLDERRQRALTRYYHAAGAGGIAVGVHTTQFEIREPRHGLYLPVLALASETLAACDKQAGRSTVRVAGICGPTAQAVSEARLARERGYHLGLLSVGGLQASEDELLARAGAVAEEIPLMGFYLQPAVGGRALSIGFWRGMAEIPNLLAIKVAAFNRYQTLDVVRAVAESGRAGEIALYTGNDDSIVVDLLTEHAVPAGGATVNVRFSGGLLGHWAFWTRRAVELLEACKRERARPSLPSRLLTLGAEITDSNAAVFDAAHGFAGCIAGIQEVLRRQGLLATGLCLDPAQRLSPGQAEEIDRVQTGYPHLNDDAFVAERLTEWLR